MESIEVKGKRTKVKAFGRIQRLSLLGKGWTGLLVICLLVFGSAQHSAAQSFSFSDLFGQGDKLLKNMITQIAALNAFETSVRQGYNELKSSLTDIGNWKNGELGAHQTYYGSLSQVNSSVKVFADEGSMAAEQQRIMSQFAAISNLSGLTAEEKSYVGQVRQMVLADCSKEMDNLQQVTASGIWVMTDDERIRRIAGIADEVKCLYDFTCRFMVRVRLLVVQRRSESDELQNLKGWYGYE